MDIKTSIKLEQMRQLFSASTMSLTGSILLAIILTHSQLNVVNPNIAIIWCIAISAVSLMRAVLVRSYQNNPTNELQIVNSRIAIYRTFIFLSAVFWGSASFLLFPVDNQVHQMVLVVITVGLTSGAVISLSADIICSLQFILLVLIPLTLKLFIEGDDFAITIGVANIVYIVFLVVNARHLHFNVYENIKMRIETSENERKLQTSEEQLKLVLQGAELGFWDWNILTDKVERNEQWAKMLGYSLNDIQQTTYQWSDFIHPEDRHKAWQSIQDVVAGRLKSHHLEYRMLHKDGSIRWILDQASIMQRDEQGNPVRMSGTHSDVTQRKEMEIRLLQQANIDYLTSASNRGYFMEQAELELSRATRYGSPLSLLMLDIDFFKQVNDTHGHKAGDAVLKKLVEVGRETLREVDIIGRIGGEEFAILLPETSCGEAVEVAERLRQVMENTKVPLDGGLPIHFSLSIGVTSLISIDDNIDVLLNLADKALYKAKASGRNKVCVAVN
jgi:diguanylate cyclase (GGDEF)-like protein/PAS domain S-box-containing protein